MGLTLRLNYYMTAILDLPCNVNVNFPRQYPTIIQKENEGREPPADPGSDDEQIPDVPQVKPFSEAELGVVQERLCESYQVSRGLGFSNAVGKAFVVALLEYLQSAATPSQLRFLCSTAGLTLTNCGGYRAR